MMYPSRFLMKLKKREEEEITNDVSDSILDVELREEEEDEFENDLYEWILDEEIMAEAEEFENDLSEWILDEEIMVEEEEFENDASALILDEECKRHNPLKKKQKEGMTMLMRSLIKTYLQMFETRTFCAMDTNNFNEVENKKHGTVCLFDYQDEDTILYFQCGHDFPY
ncbi:hypothetical protein HAX54_011668 [Datura stramonium]|uniref:Uncharacterized protein n=1 Tax=Datura stramonium TaxID=4076 RepID=A0ABS8Y0K8_DATST|nr:hypothetical protein [Datura stramonium]